MRWLWRELAKEATRSVRRRLEDPEQPDEFDRLTFGYVWGFCAGLLAARWAWWRRS